MAAQTVRPAGKTCRTIELIQNAERVKPILICRLSREPDDQTGGNILIFGASHAAALVLAN